MPRCATARSASVTDPGDPDRLDHVGEAAHQHLVPLAADDAGAAQRRQLLPVPVVGVGEHDVVGPAGSWPPRPDAGGGPAR